MKSEKTIRKAGEEREPYEMKGTEMIPYTVEREEMKIRIEIKKEEEEMRLRKKKMIQARRERRFLLPVR